MLKKFNEFIATLRGRGGALFRTFMTLPSEPVGRWIRVSENRKYTLAAAVTRTIRGNRDGA